MLLFIVICAFFCLTQAAKDSPLVTRYKHNIHTLDVQIAKLQTERSHFVKALAEMTKTAPASHQRLRKPSVGKKPLHQRRRK